MKKFAILLTVFAVLGNSGAYAQERKSTGYGAAASSTSSNDNMAWLIGLGIVGVVATVVGITVASATTTPSSYGH